MAKDDANEPPAKRARPTSLEDVVVERAAPGRKAGHGMLTLEEIAGDKLTQLATKHWSKAALSLLNPPAFSPAVVEQIYMQELGGDRNKPPLLKRVMLLEVMAIRTTTMLLGQLLQQSSETAVVLQGLTPHGGIVPAALYEAYLCLRWSTETICSGTSQLHSAPDCGVTREYVAAVSNTLDMYQLRTADHLAGASAPDKRFPVLLRPFYFSNPV
eukprot:GHRR01037167.1.p1 GENE.GHRR01037167.1~~GHRR01037167.1.p1  ORF type:complete len:214 (+),score=50.01 GHRR01037167.1:151-792(+)